jgi:hypothetical protein
MISILLLLSVAACAAWAAEGARRELRDNRR